MASLVSSKLIAVKPLSAPSVNLVYMDFVYTSEGQTIINNIFNMLTKIIFTEEDEGFSVGTHQNIHEFFKNDIVTGSIKHQTKKRSNGEYWTTIRILLNKEFFKDNKHSHYRNILYDMFKDKNVETEFGTLVKFNVRTRSLIYNYTYYLKGLKVVNKFKL